MNKQKIAFLFLAVTAVLISCKPKSFTKLKSGVEYLIVKDKDGKPAKDSSIISMHITTKIKDSVLFDSYKMNNGKPVETMINTQGGDPIMEAFSKLSAGDSCVIKCIADSLFKGQFPPFAKSGDMVSFYVNMISVKTVDEFKKEQEENAKKQVGVDDKLIQEYLTKNNLTAQKTASGLYYIITAAGSGANAQNGQQVTMKYSGTLLDGTMFDSNVDPKFQHVEPFTFPLGAGQVIKGWDEGIALLNKGAKATFIIPSTLAYGAQEKPGNPTNPKGIPANSVLIFNVEVIGMK